MTKGAAKMSETEANPFPIKFVQGQREKDSLEKRNDTIAQEKSIRIVARDRFLRLKKSLRKRSVSIL